MASAAGTPLCDLGLFAAQLETVQHRGGTCHRLRENASDPAVFYASPRRNSFAASVCLRGFSVVVDNDRTDDERLSDSSGSADSVRRRSKYAVKSAGHDSRRNRITG